MTFHQTARFPILSKTTSGSPTKQIGHCRGGPTYAATPFDVAAAKADKDANKDVGIAVADGKRLLAELTRAVGGGVRIFTVLEHLVVLAGVLTFVTVSRSPYPVFKP